MKVTRFFPLVLACAMLMNCTPASTPANTSGSSDGVKTDTGYEWPKNITMLGGSAGGNAILSIGAIAQLVTKYTPSTAVAQVTAGAIQNCFLMQEGEGTYGWVSEQQINQAVSGFDSFADNPLKTQIMLIANYSKSVRQLIARKCRSSSR